MKHISTRGKFGSLLGLCIVLFATVVSRAQIFEERIDAGGDEVTKSIFRDGGNLIHVGYDHTGGSNLGLIFSTTTVGVVNWYTRVTLPGLLANSDIQLNKVIRATNNNYYAAGWAKNGAGPYQGLICEFSPAGALLNANLINNGVEIRYIDLCQLQNNSIAAVGWNNNNLSSALISIFDVATNHLASRSYNRNNGFGPKFTAVTHQGNIIIAGGNDANINTFDGVLTYLDATVPAAPAYVGTWDYAPNNVRKIHGVKLLDGFWFNKLVFDNATNRILANVALTDNWAGTTEDGGILEINNATHGVNNAIQYGDPATLQSNSVGDMFNVVNYTAGSMDYIVGISPGATSMNSGTQPLPNPAYGTVIMRIQANAATVHTRTLQHNTIFSADADVAGSLLYCSGATTNPLGGLTDIYEHYTNFTFTSPDCPMNDYPVATAIIPVPSTPYNWTETQQQFGNNHTPIRIIAQGNADHICGSLNPPPGDCDLQCYWRVTGNTITAGNNIFGTITNDDINIISNNSQRAVIKNSGFMGIKQLTPTTTLDIDCSPTSAPSGLRLENLPTKDGRALVIDPTTGDVYMANSHLFKPADTKDLQDQINSLQQQINALNILLTGNVGTTDGGTTLTVSPNPTDGKATASYMIKGPFTTATLRIVDNTGRLLQEIPISGSSGAIGINLPGGTASNQLMCSLIVDNKLAATQKVMLLNK